MPDASLTTCSLAMAGIGVTIVCSDPHVAAAARERYAHFPADAPIQLVAEITVVERAVTPSLLDAPLCFRNIITYFGVDAGIEYVDVERGQARLTIRADHALEEVEYFLRIVYALLVFRAGGLLFHAAGIVRRDRGYLFFGYSGSGKTTVARLSPHDRVLNDDLVVLLPAARGWIVHATPFSNPTQVQPVGPCSAPIAALLRLVQNTTVHLEAVTPAQGLAEIVASVPVISTDPDRSFLLLERCQRLLREVPIYRLHFLPDDSFWPAVETITGERDALRLS